MTKATDRPLVLMTEKTVNIIVSIVLAATPLYENIARRWVFYYLVRQLILRSFNGA